MGVMGDPRGGPGGCEGGQTSRYADLLGIPVAFYGVAGYAVLFVLGLAGLQPARAGDRRLADRKSTRLNSSHLVISYAVFCLKKKKNRQAPGAELTVYPKPFDTRQRKSTYHFSL